MSTPTHFKNSQNRFEGTEEILELLVSAVEDYAIFALDPRGYILTWNAGAQRLKGYSADEAIGMHFSKFYTPADIERHHPEEELTIAEANGKYEEEGWRVRKDGSLFWANVVITALRSPDGELRGFAKVTRDLTERRRSENDRLVAARQSAIHEQTLENERTLDRIYANSPSFMTYLSVPEYRYIKSNAEHEKLVRKRDIVGKRVQDVLPEMESQGMIKTLDEVVRSGEPFVAREVPLRYDDREAGTSRTEYLDFVYQPFKNPNGAVYGIAVQGTVVTEKVLSRHAVENERMNFRNLFKQTPEMVCILGGPEHVFEFVNASHIRVLGFDATGMSVRQAQPESVEVHGILDDVYRTGKTAELHEIPVTIGDQLRYFNLTYAARRDLLGRINGIMILGVEITQQVLTKIRLAENLEISRENEQQLQILLNSIPQIVWMSRPDGQVFWYNNRWHEYTGMGHEDVGKSDPQSYVEPMYLAQVNRILNECLKKGTSFEMEIPLRDRSGRHRWFLSRMEPISDSSGAVVRWIGTSTDIDERRRISQNNRILSEASALFAQSLDYEKTLQALASIIVSHLADWCSIAIQEPGKEPRIAASAHPDPERLELVRELFRDYPTDWDRPNGVPNVLRTGKSELHEKIELDQIREAAKDDRHFRLIQELKMKSGMIVPLIANGRVVGAITFISSNEHRVYSADDLALAEEIGRRAGIAVENGFLYARAQHAIQARDQFLSIASHELKTPLTSLKLQAQIRARNMARGNQLAFTPEKLLKYFTDDDKQIVRLVRLVDDMLDVSRLNSGKLVLDLQKEDLCAVIREVADRFSPQFESAGVKIQVEADCPTACCIDRYRIEQVVSNLLSNAIKYGNGSPVLIRGYASGADGIIEVSEQGGGIAENDQKRIFHQFERAVSENGVSGLGLGLYIVRQLIEAHGGEITLKSRLGEGSTFIVRLPLEQKGQDQRQVEWARD